MATLTFYSVVGNSGCSAAALCSGRSLASNSNGIGTDTSSPADSRSNGITCQSSETNVVTTAYECSPALGNWASGTYAVTVDITTANMNLTLQEIHICRVNSSCTNQATVGSLTGIARGLGSTGAVTHNVTGSAQAGASSTDKFMVLLVCTNGAMSLQQASLAVTIASPIDSSTPVDMGGGKVRT